MKVVVAGLFLCLWSCQVPPVAALACLKPMLDANDVPVVWVGDNIIGEKQLLRRLQHVAKDVPQGALAPTIEDILADEIRFVLLAQAALDRNYAQNPEVIEVARKEMISQLLQHDLVDDGLTDGFKESGLKAYYEAHQAEYQQPGKCYFLEMVWPLNDKGQVQAQKMLSKLQEASETLFVATQKRLGRKNMPEEQLVGKWQTHEALVHERSRPFADGVFQTPPGHVVSQLLSSSLGWHIVFVKGCTESLLRRYDEVKEQIREKFLHIQRAKIFDMYTEQLRELYPVERDEEALQKLIVNIQTKKL